MQKEHEHSHHPLEHHETHTHDHHDDHAHHDDHSTHDHHEHHHGSDHTITGWLKSALHLGAHSHDHGDLINEVAITQNEVGIRTVWIALAALAFTSLVQVGIVWLSGSVALLADTAHNIGDGLNSIPLLIAFYLARHAATRRYTYGYGKAEDVAGIFIVLSIAISAGIIFWESLQKFLHPQPITHVGWVAAAAVVGFLGNEAVAILQIRIGREIGSAAMVADGLHARTDGLTSLAVLLAVGGSLLGYPIVDPIIGILIGITILFITKDATVTMWYRLMDAIEPELFAKAETAVSAHPQVHELRRLRMRWIGHQLHAELIITVDAQITTAASHQIAEEVRHNLFHAIDRLAEIIVHLEPGSPPLEETHQLTLHHEPVPQAVMP